MVKKKEVCESQHVLSALPFAENALEPVVSAYTVSIHYGKHHKGYCDALNGLITGTKFACMPLEKIIMESAGKDAESGIFNNAAQLWNHTFYWNCLRPQEGEGMPGLVKQKIEASFGTVEACKKEIVQAASKQFGSGWVWLVLDGKKLAVMKTSNADVPLTKGMTPLLVIDVWEHAYYLDYQNRRVEYVSALLDSRINWEFVATNIKEQ
jgi:Fe-Mn family superoxide dismutase